MKVIDIENHFASVAWLDARRNNKTRYLRMAEDPDGKTKLYWAQDIWVYYIGKRLQDLGEVRIKHLDEAGIDMAVLSRPPELSRSSPRCFPNPGRRCCSRRTRRAWGWHTNETALTEKPSGVGSATFALPLARSRTRCAPFWRRRREEMRKCPTSSGWADRWRSRARSLT